MNDALFKVVLYVSETLSGGRKECLNVWRPCTFHVHQANVWRIVFERDAVASRFLFYFFVFIYTNKSQKSSKVWGHYNFFML